MDSDERMIQWSAAWTLAGGLVVCTVCMRGQPISQSGEFFTHEASCKAKNAVAAMPWAHLHQVLDDERG